MNDTKALKPVVSPSSQLVVDRRVDGPGAMMQTLAAMQSAIGQMGPDDLVIECESVAEQGKNTTRFKLRAYKRAKD